MRQMVTFIDESLKLFPNPKEKVEAKVNMNIQSSTVSMGESIYEIISPSISRSIR
jgi:hypothetical protein